MRLPNRSGADVLTPEQLDNAAQGRRRPSYTYDTTGRVSKIVYPYTSQEGDLIGSEEFLYNDLGQLVLKKDGAGTKTAYDYDDFGRVSGIDYGYAAAFQLPLSGFSADVTYTYDGPTSQVTDVDGTINGVDVGGSYTYDSRGRIETYTPDLPSGYGTISYTWNNLGQKTSMTVPMGYGNKGRKIEYRYDNSGRQVGMVMSPVDVTSSTTLETTTAGSNTLMAYDANQNRVKLINKAGDVYYFVYDPTASIPAVVYEQGPSYRYLNTREPDGGLVSREKYDANGINTGAWTYHFDGLGSTMALTDPSGQVTDTYTYDAWGNRTSYTGSTADNPYQYVGKYGYYTHYQEPDFGLLQLGVRYYDAGTGRFTSRDPAKDGINHYLYGRANALGFIDPTGNVALSNKQWKVLGCHLQALCSAFSQAKRGSDPGYLQLQADFCGKMSSRDKYWYDPHYEEVARNDYYAGIWFGLKLGTLMNEFNGKCDYSESATMFLIHEFMHFNDGYWRDFIRGNKIPGTPYTGEDPHMYYNNVARMWIDILGNKVKSEVKKCCCKKGSP